MHIINFGSIIRNEISSYLDIPEELLGIGTITCDWEKHTCLMFLSEKILENAYVGVPFNLSHAYEMYKSGVPMGKLIKEIVE